MMTLIGLVALWGTPEPSLEFFKPGATLWVGRGMAAGYDLPFGKKLTIARVRVLFRREARIVFEQYPQRRFYLRTDFGPDYAFRAPLESAGFSQDQWETIRRGVIEVGMPKQVFLCIRPKSPEIYYHPDPRGPIEQWIYRENPVALFGRLRGNPPTQVVFFQNDVLIKLL